MDKSILVQQQVKNNADDLQKEFLDMKNWEKQMKLKDDELKKEANDEVSLPPVRSKHKGKVTNGSVKQNGNDIKSKRIKSHDYSAWDKFDVDKACEELDKNKQSDDSEGEPMSKEELEKAHQEATKHKNEGNIFVQQQKWSKAVGCYNEAIKLFPYDAIFYANRALCQLKLDNFYSAESDCSAAIQLDETYVKAYHRRATARMNLKQYKEAKKDLEKVLKLEPSNKEAKLLLNQIENKMKILETSTVVKEDTENLSKKPIEKKIAEKIWGNTKTNIETSTGDIKDTKCIKTDKDIKGVKNVISTIDDKKSNVADVIADGKRNLRIPDWLPEKDNVIIIEPIKKPPHLRSKKSLTKIPVEEVDFNTIYYKHDDHALNSKSEQFKEKEKVSENSNSMKDNNCIKVSEPLENISIIIPPVPKTAVQFVMNWKNKSSEFRYKYLKQLPVNSLPTIFQDSMDSDIFSEILEVLRIEFLKNKDVIFQYLKDLSQVKRFKTLIMFTSKSDKESLKTLFEYCKIVENIPEVEVSVLQDKYEI
ncbi:RNA polymerase II-associated protein spaghetti [Xylocopa sonorina]|uniref:RNA polymerase II-associated protein spaghetti n=1 Tax=Xylocopa sonorina TaxID=1818115 RepID=UPI00403AC94D